MVSEPVARDAAETPDASAPQIDLRPGTIVRLGKPDSVAGGTFSVSRRIGRHGSTPSRVELQNMATGQILFLTDDDFAFKALHGEFDVIFDPDGRPVMVPPTLAELSDEETAYCNRCKVYVDACLALGVEYRRSRHALDPAIGTTAASRNEEAPGFTTVLGYIDRWQCNGERFGIACFAHGRNPGNSKRTVLVGDVETAVKHGVIMALRMSKGSGEDALSQARIWMKEHRPDAGDVSWPSLRTVQREMAGMNRYVAEDLRYGRRSAGRRYQGIYERPRPALPLEEVECDHTALDVLVFDEERSIVFGRPDIITFRDRCTGCCLGMSIGFEAPSYPSFLNGLRHAFYPKDMGEYPGIKNPWFCYGRFKRLYVDNAMHFIGENIRNAAANLGFELAEFRPGEPWLKGAEEGLFGILNTKIHNLPGSVFSNVEERKRHAEEGRLPVLTITELRAYLTRYICDIYHVEKHEGLGPLRTLKDIPYRVWCSRINEVKIAPLPPAENFIALAGDVDMRAVTVKGVRWDHIRYQSAELDILRTHPLHRLGAEAKGWRGRKHQGSRFRVTRDPFDIGAIIVTNPYPDGPRTFTVAAVRQDYSAGLTLHQHRVLVANQQRKILEAAEEPEAILMQVKDDMNAAIADLLRIRGKYDIQRKLARFLEAGARKQNRSVVTTKIESAALSSTLLDPRAPIGLPKPSSRSPNAVHVTPPSPGAAGPLSQIETSAASLPTRIDPGSAAATKPAPANKSPASSFDLGDIRRQMNNDEDWSDV